MKMVYMILIFVLFYFVDYIWILRSGDTLKDLFYPKKGLTFALSF